MAEFFGMMIIMIVGAGTDCQVMLAVDPKVSASPKGVSICPHDARLTW